MTAGRVSQAAIEVLLQAVPFARPTQQAAELLLRPTARGRTGQQAVEVLRTVATTGLASGGRPLFILCNCSLTPTGRKSRPSGSASIAN